MTSRLAEMTSRNFSPSLAPELSGEARKAVNAAFDAMSTWRTETVDSFEIVVDKMAVAARALGWPQQIVDDTCAQLQDVIKMQIQTTDRLMDAWEEQIKSPSSSYMQIAQQWQKTCSDAMGVWANANKPINWRT